MTGCHFIPPLLSARRITLHAFDDVDVKSLDQHLIGSGREGCFAIAVFPGIDCEASLVAFLKALMAHGGRWRCQDTTREADNEFLLHLEWLTEDGKWSSCMGFAPLMTMPVPRRLPFVCLGLWPGRQRRSTGECVDFSDIDHQIPQAER